MADQLEEEEARAERAREFRTNLNTPKSSRKRYSIAAPYAGYKQGLFDYQLASSGCETCLTS